MGYWYVTVIMLHSDKRDGGAAWTVWMSYTTDTDSDPPVNVIRSRYTACKRSDGEASNCIAAAFQVNKKSGMATHSYVSAIRSMVKRWKLHLTCVAHKGIDSCLFVVLWRSSHPFNPELSHNIYIEVLNSCRNIPLGLGYLERLFFVLRLYVLLHCLWRITYS